MADQSKQIVLDALSRAAAAPMGLPMIGGRNASALFPASASAKEAAQVCKDQGYLCVLRTENRGKTPVEIATISDKGLAYLLDEVSPKKALEGFVHALAQRQTQLADLLGTLQQTQAALAALKENAEKVLARIQQPHGNDTTGNGTWSASLLAHLAQWRASGVSDDCPLPELFRRVQKSTPTLTVGHFHDALRRYHAQEKIYLHPWTGPLYEIPEPALALLIGHEVAYYASIRGD